MMLCLMNMVDGSVAMKIVPVIIIVNSFFDLREKEHDKQCVREKFF